MSEFFFFASFFIHFSNKKKQNIEVDAKPCGTDINQTVEINSQPSISCLVTTT